MSNRAKTNVTALLWLQILLVLFWLPRELVFTMGPLVFTPYRVLLILLVPYVIWSVIKGRFHWLWCDFLALILFLWPLFAYMVTAGIATTIETGGVLVLETAIPYFLTRLAITNYRSLKRLSNTVLVCILVLAVTALPEAFTGRFYIREIGYALTGNTYDYSVSQRLGLWRAMGATPHPLFLGTICASGFIIAAYLASRQRYYLFAFLGACLGVFISLSSAPLLSIVFQLFIVGWSFILRGYKAKWWLLLSLVILVYVVIDLLSNRDPFRVMFSYLLFNTETGYARYYMWQNSLYLINLDVKAQLFGYGNSMDFVDLLESSYWASAMRRSIDSFWLMRMLTFGWPILFMHAVFLITLYRKVITKYRRLKVCKERALVKSWIIASITMTLIAFTIDFWGQMGSFYYVLLAAPIGASYNAGRKKKCKATDNRAYAGLSVQKVSYR